MDTKPLLYGIIGFLLGGFIVSLAATTFDKPSDSDKSMTMSEMSSSLEGKAGDEFDKAFIAGMIEHHEGAVEMAELAKDNAKHDEIKQMSDDIIKAQTDEINRMKQWQTNWGYGDTPASPHSGH